MRRWWQRRSLRFRLAAWYAAAGALLIAAFGAAVYLYVARSMARPLDYELRRDLADIRQHLQVRADETVLWDGAILDEEVIWDMQRPWFELWNENRVLVRRLWPSDMSDLRQPPVPPVQGRETISVFNISDEVRLRVLSVPYTVPGLPEGWMLRVISVHRPQAEALGALRAIIFVALPTVIVLLTLGGVAITRRWLKPLGDMAAEADRITADNLGHRLPVANPHDELGRLASVFNVTLARLEDSFATLDRFVADASHELRTPLTTLRAVGEVGLRGNRTPAEYCEIIGSMLEEAQRLQLLVQRLLELASAEGGAPSLRRERLRLDKYVTACAAELGVLAEIRHQHVRVETVPCTAVTDPVLFRQALQNLLDNAFKYSPDGTTITVVVSADTERCHVAVSDEGPGINREHRTRLAQRFFRPDSGRGRSKGGFGLGLAITRAYMTALGGTLEHVPRAPHGSIFRLSLPRG